MSAIEFFDTVFKAVLTYLVPRMVENILRHARRLALRLKPVASGVVSVTLPRIRVHGEGHVSQGPVGG
jgi:hypothetical protein